MQSSLHQSEPEHGFRYFSVNLSDRFGESLYLLVTTDAATRLDSLEL